MYAMKGSRTLTGNQSQVETFSASICSTGARKTLNEAGLHERPLCWPLPAKPKMTRLSQPLLSWHLRRLRRAGVVKTERVGRQVRCTFDRERFAQLHDRGFRTLMNPGGSR